MTCDKDECCRERKAVEAAAAGGHGRPGGGWDGLLGVPELHPQVRYRVQYLFRQVIGSNVEK